MLLVNHSALSDLKNSKLAILMWKRKKPKKFEDSELQALLDEDDAQTQQQLANQLNVTREVSIRLKSMGKIQKMGKWIPHELNEKDSRKTEKPLAKCCSSDTKENRISPSNCDWR